MRYGYSHCAESSARIPPAFGASQPASRAISTSVQQCSRLPDYRPQRVENRGTMKHNEYLCREIQRSMSCLVTERAKLSGSSCGSSITSSSFSLWSMYAHLQVAISPFVQCSTERNQLPVPRRLSVQCRTRHTTTEPCIPGPELSQHPIPSPPLMPLALSSDLSRSPQPS